MKRIITFIYLMSLLFAGYVYADDIPLSISEGYISFGLEHSQSNNIRKTSNNKRSGYEQRADLTLGYTYQSATNNSVLDYTVDYSHYSEADFEDESNLSGSFNINQQIFTENLQLDLGHFRHSYLLNQSSVDLPGNSGDRDVFTVSPLWRLPYSKRAGFETRYTFTAVRFSDNDQQETDRNSIGLAWYHALSAKTTFRLDSQFSEIEYLFSQLTYEQINLNMSLSGNLTKGAYSAQAGYSRLAVLDHYEEGGIFKFTYNYLFQKNAFFFSVQRELTDSSLGLGQDVSDNGDASFDGSKLLWIDRVSLDHQLFAFNTRLTNTNTIYYQQETPLVTREVEPRAGVSTQLSWQHTHLLTTSFRANYSQTYIEKNIEKKEWGTQLSSKYFFHPKFTFALTAQYKEQIKNEGVSGYDEVRLIANIRFTH